jgi:hypothetical protein
MYLLEEQFYLLRYENQFAGKTAQSPFKNMLRLVFLFPKQLKTLLSENYW